MPEPKDPKTAGPGLRELLEGKALGVEQERKLLAAVDPAQHPALLELYAARLRKLGGEHAKLQAAWAQLHAPPLHPATVLRRAGEDRVEISIGGRRTLLPFGGDVSAADLCPGREVLLSSDLAAVIAAGSLACAGSIATVCEIADAALVVRAAGEEESVVGCDPDLLAKLEPGDRVVLASGAPIALRVLPRRTQSEFELREPPAVGFERIGGHEQAIAEIRRDLDLHLCHPATARAFRLELPRGILLVGPPGVGKTLLASAIAGHLGRHRESVRFLSVPPGALRGVWYGSSEQRIRELFGIARAHPGLVVIFLDEVDSFGARGNGAGHDLDGRVLGALLHELQGLGSSHNLLVIGATNRIDLCDDALVRPGRLGDRRYFFRRPDRRAARSILAGNLLPELPFADPQSGREQMIEIALAHLYAREGGAGVLARATLGDGTGFEIRARDVVSGAMLASAVERAKHVAAQRVLGGGPGLAPEDLLAALDEALDGEALRLGSEHAARRALDHPDARRIARVTVAPERRLHPHRYARFA
jgi:proteasome-associated ATPase